MLHLHVQGLSWLMWHAAHWQLCFPLYLSFLYVSGNRFLMYSWRCVCLPFGWGWWRACSNYKAAQEDPKRSRANVFRWFCRALSHCDLGFAAVLPGTLLTRRFSQGEEHAHLASSSTISPPRFLLSAYSRGSSDWRHRDTPCGDQVRRLSSFAFLRCKGTAARCAVSPPFVCTHRFHSNTHCTAVGPCNGAQRLRLCLHYLWVFARPRRLSEHISQSGNI